jgi:HSP20 family protein
MIRRKDRNEGLVPKDYWGANWISPMAVMNDMDRLFDDFRSEWENTFLAPRAFSADLVRQPLVDLADKGNEYLVKAELPGINKEDVNIEVTENSIEISGETKTDQKEEDKKSGYLRQERRYASFYRSLPLPDEILTEKADAELKDGILTVRLPKKTAPPQRNIKKLPVK